MILDKAKMAHEYFRDTMAFIRQNNIKHKFDEIIKESWEYADAMQAEADKRKSKPELPSLQQTFINGVEQPRYAPTCEEWQPDWSQAPAWANYIAVYSDCCNASYFEKEPKIISGYTWGGTDGKSVLTPIPVYTGNWQDSLRKRP